MFRDTADKQATAFCPESIAINIAVPPGNYRHGCSWYRDSPKFARVIGQKHYVGTSATGHATLILYLSARAKAPTAEFVFFGRKAGAGFGWLHRFVVLGRYDKRVLSRRRKNMQTRSPPKRIPPFAIPGAARMETMFVSSREVFEEYQGFTFFGQIARGGVSALARPVR